MGCCQTITQEKAEFDMLLSASSLKKTKPTQEQESEGDESFNDISLDSSSYDRLHAIQDYNNQKSFVSSLNRSEDQFLVGRQERSLTNSFNLETAMSCASTKMLEDLYKQTDSRGTNFRHLTAPYRVSRMSVYRKNNTADLEFMSQAQNLANRLEEMRLNLNIQKQESDLVTDFELLFDANNLHATESPLGLETKLSVKGEYEGEERII